MMTSEHETKLLARETKRFAVEQRGRSWWNLASTVGVFSAAVWIASTGFPLIVRLPASILLSLVHVRMFVLYHDYLHGAILRGSKFADILFKLYGLLALAPSSIWKHTHDHHHRNNARRFGVDSVGTYPVMTTGAYRKSSPGARFFYALSRHPLTIVFGYLTVFFYGFCIQPLLSSPRRHGDVIAAIGLHLGLFALLAVIRPDILLLALVLPWFLASALGSYLFYAQHNYPGAKIRHGTDWDYVFAAIHSSSYIRMNPVMRWFTGNIGYHHVHHLNARIPFYRLPEAMDAIEGLQTPGTTSLSPADIVRCLGLKLWDPERNRFVSFAKARKAEAAYKSSRDGESRGKQSVEARWPADSVAGYEKSCHHPGPAETVA